MAAVCRVVEAAAGLDIGVLTLFAFSQDNWWRPAAEVAGLMRIFEQFLAREAPRLTERGVRISVVGRRDRLPPQLLAAVSSAEAASLYPPPDGAWLRGHALRLRLAIDYSGRDAILRAARRLNGAHSVSPEVFGWLLAEDEIAGEPVPDVDLLIRTGRERRLSDCPLWEIAYAELVFTECLWPDFGAAELAAALREFHARERRFGRIPEPVVS
jgi:undecaprenyl diphosphate synthase